MKRKLIFSALILSLLFVPSLGSQVKISIAHPPNEPIFIGIPEHDIDSDKCSTVVLRIRSTKSGIVGLFWTSALGPKANEPTGLWFYVGKPNVSREYVINAKLQNRYWAGLIKQIVIHPESGTEGFIIESAVAEPSNLVLNIRSGWLEFWGPRSRLILGSTVNMIEATRLCNIPINWYAYVIILISSVLMFAYSLFRTKDPVFSLQACGKTAIIAAIVLWGGLEFSSSVNQYNQLKTDLDRYGIKSLEQKRAALVGEIVGDDFYKFIGFCGNSIKSRSSVSIITSGPDAGFYEGRIKYFLYPMDFFSKDPEYLIVINNDKNFKDTLGEHPGFRLFKQYNEGAYILWKKK